MSTLHNLNNDITALYESLMAARDQFEIDRNKAVAHIDEMRQQMITRYELAIESIDKVIGSPNKKVLEK